MSRIKLVPLNHYQHIFETSVEVTDLNYGNHMGNDALVGMLHRARVHFLHWIGAHENNLGDGETGIVLADLVVNYRREGFLFDPLKIESSIAELQSKSLRMFHKVTTGQSRLVALAEVGIVAFNYRTRKVARIPASFTAKVKNLQTRSDT